MIIFLVIRQFLLDFPSIACAANVNGAPTNPIKLVLAFSASVVSLFKISLMNGNVSSKLTALTSFNVSTSASVRI